MSRPIITVVGSFAVGMTVRTDRMPVFGETLIGSDFDMGPGGKGSNQAVAAARLGAESHFVGLIGDDKLGAIATDLYASEGVRTEHLWRTGARPTGVGIIVVNRAGDNGIILDMGANELLTAERVLEAEAQIAASDLVMTVLEIPLEAAAQAMALGRKHGVQTLFNPAPAQRLPTDMLSDIDILTPNEIELRILLGREPDDPTPTPELARELKAHGVDRVIVTMGGRGALLLNEDGTENRVAPVQVDVVDTTGAGDAFNAGLAVALAEGKRLEEAVAFASCTGALACTRLGVIPSLARRAEAERKFMTTSHERTAS